MTQKVYTVERTAKSWKGLQALGCLAFTTGLVLTYAGTTVMRTGSGGTISEIVLSNLAISGVLGFLGGLTLQVVGRLGAWWFHG